MHVSSFFDDEFEEHASVVAATRAELRAPFDALVDVCADSLAAGGKILFFGNGGSAADAQHLAGWRALAQRRRTRASVSSPESVVRSIRLIAFSSHAA